MPKFIARIYVEFTAKDMSNAEEKLMKSVHFEVPFLAEIVNVPEEKKKHEKVNKEELCEFKDFMKTLKTIGE